MQAGCTGRDYSLTISQDRVVSGYRASPRRHPASARAIDGRPKVASTRAKTILSTRQLPDRCSQCGLYLRIGRTLRGLVECSIVNRGEEPSVFDVVDVAGERGWLRPAEDRPPIVTTRTGRVSEIDGCVVFSSHSWRR